MINEEQFYTDMASSTIKMFKQSYCIDAKFEFSFNTTRTTHSAFFLDKSGVYVCDDTYDEYEVTIFVYNTSKDALVDSYELTEFIQNAAKIAAKLSLLS